jgi:hypothetical protein
VILISDNQTAASARYEIDRAMHGGQGWELFLEDRSAGHLTPQNFEFEIAWGKLIFAWWNEDNSQSWRITGYEIDRAEIRLQARRGMGAEFSLLCLRDRERWSQLETRKNLPLSERRKRYANILIGLVAQKLENARIGTPATSGGSRRMIRGGYVRFWARLRGETTLYIGACEGESQPVVDDIVCAALLWLETYNGRRPDEKKARRIAICIPAGRSRTVLERLTFLRPDRLSAGLECYEVDEEAGTWLPVRAFTQYELLNLHAPELSWPQPPAADGPWKDRILSLAPDRVEARELSPLHAEPGAGGLSFSLHGLEFARTVGADPQKVRFGIAGGRGDDARDERKLLTEANFPDLEGLVRQILEYRTPHTPDPRHPFYRLREEAWLESMLRRDIQILDAGFDPTRVYSQVPAWRGEERSVIDLLTVDHQGRLAVIEIKASEDAELPMQGLDYWLRVEQARLRGEFPRRGLFRGLSLADRPPLLYLVAPRLRFHRSFLLTAQSLAPEIEVWQIGINSNWRRGVKIYSKNRL